MRVAGGVAGVVGLAAIGWGWACSDWEPERERAIAVALGWVACAFLAATLTASLSKKARPWRRALGLATAALAAAHVVVAFVGPLAQAWSVAWTWPRYRAGLLAFAVLLVLFATSFPKRFRVPEWQALHRLVYVVAVLVVLHVTKLASAWLAGALAVVIIALLVARAAPRRLR